jgi:hypothetical protein
MNLPIHQLEVLIQWGAQSALGYLSMVPAAQQPLYLEALINRITQQLEQRRRSSHG